MKSLFLSGLFVLFSALFNTYNAQTKHTKSEIVKVSGNCSMCKATIEKAVGKENGAAGTWNTKTKLLSVSYDPLQTNLQAILKQVAGAGYDNQLYKAPDSAYRSLPDCCQYERNSSTK